MSTRWPVQRYLGFARRACVAGWHARLAHEYAEALDDRLNMPM